MKSRKMTDDEYNEYCAFIRERDGAYHNALDANDSATVEAIEKEVDDYMRQKGIFQPFKGARLRIRIQPSNDC